MEQMEREAGLSAMSRKTLYRPGVRGSGEDTGGREGGGMRKFIGGQVSFSGTTDFAVHLKISPLISLARITSSLLQVVTSMVGEALLAYQVKLCQDFLAQVPSLSTLIPNAGHPLTPSKHLLRSAEL